MGQTGLASSSEQQFQCKLNISAQACTVDHTERARTERSAWSAKRCRIRDVEGLTAKLETHRFSEWEFTVNSQIQALPSRCMQHVSPQIPI